MGLVTAAAPLIHCTKPEHTLNNTQSYIHINTASRPRQHYSTNLSQRSTHHPQWRLRFLLRQGEGQILEGRQRRRWNADPLLPCTFASYEDGDSTLVLSPLHCSLAAMLAAQSCTVTCCLGTQVSLIFTSNVPDGLWSAASTAECQTTLSNDRQHNSASWPDFLYW